MYLLLNAFICFSLAHWVVKFLCLKKSAFKKNAKKNPQNIKMSFMAALGFWCVCGLSPVVASRGCSPCGGWASYCSGFLVAELRL